MKKGHFFKKKGTKNLLYLIHFVCVLHQNKALYNFQEGGQCCIVKLNMGLGKMLYLFGHANRVPKITKNNNRTNPQLLSVSFS